MEDACKSIKYEERLVCATGDLKTQLQVDSYRYLHSVLKI